MAGIAFGSKAGPWTERFLTVIDAAAVVLFAVAGATRALDANLTWLRFFLPALLLGVITAVGGGPLRDSLSSRTPRVFERGELYAIVAAFAAGIFLLCNYVGMARPHGNVAWDGRGLRSAPVGPALRVAHEGNSGSVMSGAKAVATGEGLVAKGAL